MSKIKWFGPVVAVVLLGLAIGGPALGGKGGEGKPGGGGGGGETARYGITDLGGFTGGNDVQSFAFGINNPDGVGLVQVVGESNIPTGSPRWRYPILWTVDDAGNLFGHEDLGLLPGAEFGRAELVNDQGLIAGHDDADGGRGWFVSPGGNMTALPTFGGDGSIAIGMNNVGDIVGSARGPDDEDGSRGESHNALWHVDLQGHVTGPIDLGTFRAHDINDAKVMVGFGEDNLTATIAWFDSQMVLQRLSIGLLNPGDIWSLGLAINNAREVAGGSEDANGNDHGFFWSVDGGMVPLGDFGGGYSWPEGLNNQGQVVGSATNRRGDGQPFLWENGTLRNLNDISASESNWDLKYAGDINDAGQIVGVGQVGGRKGERHGFLLTLLP